MKINDYQPTVLLRPFIKTYRIIESQYELVNRVLPTTSPAMAFCFNGENSYITNKEKNNLPTATFSGLRNTVRLINYLKNTSTLIVLFKETGASAFLKEPLHHLFEESIALDTIIHPIDVSIVEEQLHEAQSNMQRVVMVEEFLIKSLCNYRADDLIVSAIQKIHASNGFMKIKDLAARLYISNDAFEKRFRKLAGASPKQFSSIVRMSSLIHKRQPQQNLLQLAFDAGYYDQPHFNKDFKHFTGQAPKDFFKSASYW